MKWIGSALLAGSLLLPPFFAGDFYINLASQILIAAIFALSLNLLVGYGGMTSLGHASYLGVAAYISALLTSRYGFGHGAGRACSRSPAPRRWRPFSASSRCAPPASAFS